MKDMETNKNIDWEQRRYEIAKEMFVRYAELPTHMDAKYAVDFADAIIEDLQKPKEQDKFSRIVEQAPEMYKALEEIACYNLNKNKFYFDDVIEMKAIAKKALEKCNVDYPEIE